MQYLFSPDELKEGVRSPAGGLEFLSCQQPEISGWTA